MLSRRHRHHADRADSQRGSTTKRTNGSFNKWAIQPTQQLQTALIDPCDCCGSSVILSVANCSVKVSVDSSRKRDRGSGGKGLTTWGKVDSLPWSYLTGLPSPGAGEAASPAMSFQPENMPVDPSNLRCTMTSCPGTTSRDIRYVAPKTRTV